MTERFLFGDKVLNTCASDDNPRKRGTFVEYRRIPRGRTNSGIWVRLTDRKGKFWETDPEVCVHDEQCTDGS